jgi:hypothetical protein
VTWVKLDDHFADHPKIVGLSDAAYRAYVDGLCYCARHLTDGAIPLAVVKVVARGRGRVILELEANGLWDQNGKGVNVHDYLEFQLSRSEVEAARLQRASAGRSGGLRSGEARRQAKRKQK